MKHQARWLPILATILVLAPTLGGARERTESVRPARVLVLDKCVLAADTAVQAKEVLNLGVAAFLQGVAGDAISAGLNVAAAAIDEASKEKAIGGAGATTFAFYTLNIKDQNAATITDRLRNAEASCLVISLDTIKTPETSHFAKLAAARERDVPGLIEAFRAQHLASADYAPALYLEARLESLDGAFRIQPVFLWYPVALPGAPSEAAAIELQTTFAVPSGSKTDGALGDVFALARIPLPAIKPGDIWDTDRLSGYSSPALPSRPSDPPLTARKDALVAAVKAVTDAKRAVDDQEVAVAYATADAAQVGAPATAKAAQLTAERTLAANKVAQARAEKALTNIIASGTAFTGGVSSLEAKLVLIRKPNAFGQAIAKSIRERGATLGTSLATRNPAWDEAASAYVLVQNGVATAELELQQTANGTPAELLVKQNALRIAKAAANKAAATAKKPIPYPDLL
jgi:hypothetical protein